MEHSTIIPCDFEYFEPSSIEEAFTLLSQYGEGKILAGGTDLLVKMKQGLINPPILVSLSKVLSLSYIQEEDGFMKIGALATLSQIERNFAVKSHFIALHEAVRSMASPAIRNAGTIGGNLANSSPAADTAPPLLAFGAKVKIESRAGSRIVELSDFFKGPGANVLKAGEILTEIQIPQPESDSGSSFLKMGRVSADIAKINCAVFISREGRGIKSCRVVLGSVAPIPLRIYQAEEVAKRREASDSLWKEIAELAAETIRPIDDVRSSAYYRKMVSSLMVEETLRAAWERSGGR